MIFARPRKAVIAQACLVVIMSLLGACGRATLPFAAPAQTPGWVLDFLGAQPDVAVTLRIKDFTRDPLYGPLLLQAVRSLDEPLATALFTRVDQIDVLATAERSDPKAWVAIVHGVPEDVEVPTDSSKNWRLFTLPSKKWVFVGKSGVARARDAIARGVVPGRLDLEPGMLVAGYIRGSAAAQAEETRGGKPQAVVKNLTGVTFGLSPSADLAITAHLFYVDDASAIGGEAAARDLLDEVSRTKDDPFGILALVIKNVDIHRDGALVTETAHFPRELIAMLRDKTGPRHRYNPPSPPPPAPPPPPEVGAPTPVVAPGTPDEAIYQRALIEQREGRADGARKLYYQLISKYPQSPRRGDAYYAFGAMFAADARAGDASKWPLAREAFNLAIKVGAAEHAKDAKDGLAEALVHLDGSW